MEEKFSPRTDSESDRQTDSPSLCHKNDLASWVIAMLPRRTQQALWAAWNWTLLTLFVPLYTGPGKLRWDTGYNPGHRATTAEVNF